MHAHANFPSFIRQTLQWFLTNSWLPIGSALAAAKSRHQLQKTGGRLLSRSRISNPSPIFNLQPATLPPTTWSLRTSNIQLHNQKEKDCNSACRSNERLCGRW